MKKSGTDGIKAMPSQSKSNCGSTDGTPRGKPVSSVINETSGSITCMLRHRVTNNVSSADSQGHAKRLTESQADESCVAEIASFRKAGSIQDISKKDSQRYHRLSESIPLARTQSFHSIVKPLTSNATEILAEVRRTSSSQNVANHGGCTRLSAPISATMAFNAELLAAFERERRALDGRISELIQVAEFRRTEAERLKIELRNQQHDLVAVEEECELLRLDNQAMRERLSELNVTVEHFTDSEKLSLLRVRRNHNPGVDVDSCKIRLASDSAESVREGDCDAALSVGSLDGNWDRVSESALTVGSGSEVSVACLQDRLLAMEETQYSTSEELAATLQELTDLQDAVNSLTVENERLADERAIVLESLCAQTQKLENARRQIEHMKALLLRDSDSHAERSENERQLAALLHGAEEEREELLLKQVELSNAVAMLDAERINLRETTSVLNERTRALELQLSCVSSEKKTLQAKLDALAEKTEFEAIGGQKEIALMDSIPDEDTNTIGETNCIQCKHLELMLRAVQNELKITVGEHGGLRSRINSLESEAVEMRSSMDLQAVEMDRRCKAAERDLVEARSIVDVLRADMAKIIEENRCSVGKLESELRHARIRAADAEQQVTELAERIESERKEWINFQRDLQTAVCVAVDIRTEAQEGVERLMSENSVMRERDSIHRREIDLLRAEISKFRSAQNMSDESASAGLNIRDRVMNTVDRELALLRHHGRRVSDLSLPTSVTSTCQPSLSVRRLISSIEEQVKADTSSSSSSPREFPDLVQKSTSVVRPVLRSISENNSDSLISDPVTLRTSLRSPCSAISESSVVRSHRHTIDGSLLSATDETKCAVAELAAAAVAVPDENSRDKVAESVRKPRTGILSNKLSKMKASTG